MFELVIAKRIKESIRIISLPDSRLIEDELEIIMGVYDHCKHLYKRDLEVSRFNVVRMEVLNLITMKFFATDNWKLHAPPSDEEIELVVLGFPYEKSPGGDGVTYDFLKGYWDFMETVVRRWF